MNRESANDTPLIDEKTVRLYLSKAEMLLERYRNTTHEEWQNDPVAACKWVASQRHSWAKATWRIYKAALIYFMRQNGPVEAVTYLQVQSQAKCKRKGSSTSSLKTKSLREEMLQPIIFRLRDSTGEYDKLIALWLLSSRFTGLRPVEWKSAQLFDGYLKVENAKHSHGRAHGDHRTIPLEHLSSLDRDVLRGFLTLLDKFINTGKTFDDIQMACMKRLGWLTKQIWPDRKYRPTLYSGRHQFVANLKSLKVPRDAIAALMGQASDATASEHYGKGKDGEPFRGGKVQANPNEVSRVRHKYQPSRQPGLKRK